MLVTLKGQFLENGKYHSNKNDCDVIFTSILMGNSVVQVKGVHMPPSCNRLDDVQLDCDIRAYNSQITATYAG